MNVVLYIYIYIILTYSHNTPSQSSYPETFSLKNNISISHVPRQVVLIFFLYIFAMKSRHVLCLTSSKTNKLKENSSSMLHLSAEHDKCRRVLTYIIKYKNIQTLNARNESVQQFGPMRQHIKINTRTKELKRIKKRRNKKKQ